MNAMMLVFSLLLSDPSLPVALSSAKTAVVTNAGVNQDAYDTVVAELRAWGKLTIVAADQQADLVISVESRDGLTANPVLGTMMKATSYFITFKQGDVVLYRDQLKGCCSFKAMVRKTLERLSKRISF